MTKEVFVTVTGTQVDEHQEKTDVIETKAQGTYYEKGKTRYVRFEEKDPEFGDPIKTTIKIKPSTVEIIKRGYFKSHMNFQIGKLHSTNYITPYGYLTLDVSTEDLNVLWTEDTGTIRLSYKLLAIEKTMVDCKVLIKIKSLTAED